MTAAPARHVARDYHGLVDAFRAIKDELGLSNSTIDTLCGWQSGYCDKVLGPAAERGISPDTLTEILWVLAARIEITIDPDRLREMEQHYEKRMTAYVRRPARISRKVIEGAKPVIFREIARRGGHGRAASLPGKLRSKIARKGGQTRMRRVTKKERSVMAKKGWETRRKHKPFERVQDFGAELRGLGGLQTSHIRALKGSTFGAANQGRKLSADERQAIETQMRREGKL